MSVSSVMDSPLFEIPSSTVSGRIRQMLHDANLDAADPHYGAPPGRIKKTPDSIKEGTLILRLIQNNKDLYDKFLQNRFCKAMAWNILPSSTYSEFAKQDYLYLLDSVKFKALRFAKLNSRAAVSEIRAQSQKITGAVDYAEEWKQTCIAQLGIPEAAMENIESSAAEIGYASFLQSRVFLDDWFSLYIITIPCVYGWYQIANMLNEDPRTDRNTLFYQTFIEPNLTDAYARKLSQFIEANRGFYASSVNEDVWNELFRTALKFEIGLFESALLQISDVQFLSAAMHGNCVFSDAIEPVDIQHLPGRAVVGRVGGPRGKIHFPIGLNADLGAIIASSTSTSKPRLWLWVDCNQDAPKLIAKTGIDTQPTTKVVNAEVFLGCSPVGSVAFYPPKTAAFMVTMECLGLLEACKVYGPKGIGVTLTLELGQEMRFCSVAVSIVP